MSLFSDLPLLASLVASLTEQGLTTPTEIQARTLPALLEGRSVVGVSETGSGKTLAYVLPVLHRLKELDTPGEAVSEAGRPRGLILVPGRELGEQVSKVCKGLTHSTRLRVRVALGGSKKKIAKQNVAGRFEVLVATPGRLVQLLDDGDLRLNDLRVFVLDEADQMLDAGFRPVAKRILSDCPRAMQRVLFSATLPQALEAVVRDLFVEAPLRVQTRGSHQIVPTLRTQNLQVVDGRRANLLRDTLYEAPNVGTLLFANTRAQCERIGQWLDEEEIGYAGYMGQMDRHERRRNLARFRSGEISILIATDLGGRGLDIERIERVINVHLPTDVDNYLHRVGRTARAGREGTVINLVTSRDEPLLAKLRKRAAKQKR